jgi:modification methylase
LKKLNGGKQMKDTDWVFGLCKGKRTSEDENGIKAHPTQKPLKLIQQVILASSNKGDVVFDPFIGSGNNSRCCRGVGAKMVLD